MALFFFVFLNANRTNSTGKCTTWLFSRKKKEDLGNTLYHLEPTLGFMRRDRDRRH